MHEKQCLKIRRERICPFNLLPISWIVSQARNDTAKLRKLVAFITSRNSACTARNSLLLELLASIEQTFTGHSFLILILFSILLYRLFSFLILYSF